MEAVKKLALDATKKEFEVKKERKQLFQYAQAHQRYDWVEQLAQLQFQRAILLMKEVRQDRKEYAKNIRLGRKVEAFKVIKKYGVDFVADDDGATGFMVALHHGHEVMINEFIQLRASLLVKDKLDKTVANYLLSGYLLNIVQKKQTASLSILNRFWRLVNPHSLAYETSNRKFQVNSHSMVYFLLVLMRSVDDINHNKAIYMKGKPEEKKITAFTMDDMVHYAALVPDDILPPYRKNRQYINSVLSSNEIGRQDFTNCKMAFARVERGVYVVNINIRW